MTENESGCFFLNTVYVQVRLGSTELLLL